jgi:hypothetical protein
MPGKARPRASGGFERRSAFSYFIKKRFEPVGSFLIDAQLSYRAGSRIGFTLWGLVLASSKFHRVKPMPLKAPQQFESGLEGQVMEGKKKGGRCRPPWNFFLLIRSEN